VHLGNITKGFKGLVACATCNHDSYKSELGFRSFVFVLLGDKEMLGVWVFVSSYIYHFIPLFT